MAQIPFDRIRAWMYRDALPFWTRHGAGGPAAFHEALTLDGAPGPNKTRRVRTIARQVYAFSHAALIGRQREGLHLARAGVETLLTKVWLGESKGWARLLDADANVLDDRADLYDFAFVLFALGWWMQSSGDRSAEPYADATLNFIERSMRHPSGRGHVHILPAETPYQQNPHMHLIEACLAMDMATGNPRWLAKAREIAALFRERFYDSKTGELTEYFDADWRPAPGVAGQILEPGHQLEWAWILLQYMRRTGEDLSSEVRGLVHAAEAWGVSPRSGLVYACVTKSGQVTDSRHRVWPQTERIKGNLALFELTGADRTPQIAAAANALLERYLAIGPRGAWIDMLAEDGAPLSTDIPASTFYHMLLAFSEILRLRGALERTAAGVKDAP